MADTDLTEAPLWGYGELAAHLNLAERTVRRMVTQGSGPRPLRLNGKTVRFRPADVHAWLDAQAAAA